MPDIAITALEGIPSIARTLFEGTSFSGLNSKQLTAAINSLKDAGSASAGSVRFKYAEAARRDGDTIYALIRSTVPDQAAEPFACLETAVLALYLRFLPASETRASRRPWLTNEQRRVNLSLPDGGQFNLVEYPTEKLSLVAERKLGSRRERIGDCERPVDAPVKPSA